VESKLGPLGTSATFFFIFLFSEWGVESIRKSTGHRGHFLTYCACPGWLWENGEVGGMKIGRGNRSTRIKPAPTPLCPPQIPLDQTRDWTRAAAVGSQRLTAWAMAQPCIRQSLWMTVLFMRCGDVVTFIVWQMALIVVLDVSFVNAYNP
jgi:hypothetical protein